MTTFNEKGGMTSTHRFPEPKRFLCPCCTADVLVLAVGKAPFCMRCAEWMAPMHQSKSNS